MPRSQPHSPSVRSPGGPRSPYARTPRSATKRTTLSTSGPDAYKPWPNEASNNPNDQSFWSLRGDFLRSGVHVYSKSGGHTIDDPLAEAGKRMVDGKVRVPMWLQIQFNVVVPIESDWVCELAMKHHGGLLVGRELLTAVQSGGQGIEPHKGKFIIHLKPACDPREETDDPRIAISYFIPYTDKAYTQAMDGTLPYHFVLTRVSKGKAAMRKKWWKF